jgi:hypothetical protein
MPASDDDLGSAVPEIGQTKGKQHDIPTSLIAIGLGPGKVEADLRLRLSWTKLPFANRASLITEGFAAQPLAQWVQQGFIR